MDLEVDGVDTIYDAIMLEVLRSTVQMEGGEGGEGECVKNISPERWRCLRYF